MKKVLVLERNELKKNELKGCAYKGYVYLDGEKENRPAKIEITEIFDAKEKPIVEINFDTPDCMGFGNIPNLSAYSISQQEAIVKSLAEVIKKYYGGKDLLAVPWRLVSFFEKEGFNIFPQLPNGQPYKRLMFAPIKTLTKQLPNFIAQQTERLSNLDKGYQFISDKNSLEKNAEEISRLFRKNADYANRDDTKKRAYSPSAIIDRIRNPQVHCLGMFDKQGNIIAFIRMYIAPGLGAYVSDLVVAEPLRHKGVASLLMQEAYKNFGNSAENIFVIAGDDDEALFYQKNLGFEFICDRQKAIELPDDKVFMFGMIPQQKLLLNYLNDLPLVSVVELVLSAPQEVTSSAALIAQFRSTMEQSKQPSRTAPSPQKGTEHMKVEEAENDSAYQM